MGHAKVETSFSSVAAVPGIVGLLLAFTGSYGVIAFLVTQRTREFGIRMALGASLRRIIVSIVADAARTALFAAAIGLALAMALARAATAALGIVPIFGVGAYVIGGTLVLIASLLAALLPSLRTGRLNPACCAWCRNSAVILRGKRRTATVNELANGR